jgi:hypothetical protein
MKVLHRSAITINYKKPFVEWHNKLFSETPMNEIMLGDSKTYLIDNIFENADYVIKKHFKVIFETELEGICTDESVWPEKLSFKMFNEWFSYEISDWVMDLSKKSINDRNSF